jgi:hypothetical protein
MRVKSGETVATVPLDDIGPDFERAELRFEGLRPPLASYEARVFIDEPYPDVRTPTDANPHYLGTQYFYGLGVADTTPEGGADVYDLAGPTQSSRRQIKLNVTQRWRAYLAQTTPHAAPLSVVAVDRDGNEIAEPDLDFEGVSLVTS